MNNVRDAVVVVTGAGTGVGRAAAVALAEKGAALVLTGRREGPLHSVVQTCRDLGAEAVAIPGDISEAAAMEHVARETVGQFGRLDVWVNNAAVHQFGAVEEVPVDEWQQVVAVNVFGTFHGVRAALPWMREQGRGTVINVASVLGRVASPYQSAYVVSKYGIRALSDAVRQEVADVPGIKVSTVLPGAIDTPLFGQAGNYTGMRVTPIKPVIDAHRVANAIVRALHRPRREVPVGTAIQHLLGMNRVAPGVTEALISRQTKQDHFADEPAQATPGSVMQPQPGPETVSGGWSQRGTYHGPHSPRAASNRRSRSWGLLAAATAVGAAVLLRRTATTR